MSSVAIERPDEKSLAVIHKYKHIPFIRHFGSHLAVESGYELSPPVSSAKPPDPHSVILSEAKNLQRIVRFEILRPTASG